MQANSWFQPCQNAPDVSGLRCSKQVARTSSGATSYVRAIASRFPQHTGEREQIVSLVLQGSPEYSDACWILCFALKHFGNDEVEQGFACHEIRTGERQDVALEPLNEGAQFGGQLMRAALILPQRFKRRCEETILAAAEGIGQTCFGRLACRADAARDATPDVRQCPALLDDVKHVTVARRVGPRGFLARAHTSAGVGNRVVGIQSLRLQIEQVGGPGVTIAMRFGGEQVAVGRSDIDAGEDGLRTVDSSSCRPTRTDERSMSAFRAMACRAAR